MCTSLPDPCLRMTGSTARVTLISPKTLRSNSDRASVSLISSSAPSSPRPALLTRTSMPPNRPTAASMACGMLSLSVTSSATANTLSEFFRSSGTRSGFRTPTTTLLPSASAARAISAPIPRDEPVTNQVAMIRPHFSDSRSHVHRGFPPTHSILRGIARGRKAGSFLGEISPGCGGPRSASSARTSQGSGEGRLGAHPAEGLAWGPRAEPESVSLRGAHRLYRVGIPGRSAPPFGPPQGVEPL